MPLDKFKNTRILIMLRGCTYVAVQQCTCALVVVIMTWKPDEHSTTCRAFM